MKKRSLRLLATLLAVALVTVPAGAQPEEGADAGVRERVERILASPGFQVEMPEGELPQAPEPRVPSWWDDLLTVLLLAAAVAGLAFLVYAVVEAIRNRRRRGAAGQPPSAAPETAAPAPAAAAAGSLPDANALAGEGRFGEAVHALLLHALALLSRRRGTPLPASLTSREVLGRSGLEGDPRQALGELVRGTERFVFAGRPLDAADWERCRTAFRALRRDVDAGPDPTPGGGAEAAA